MPSATARSPAAVFADVSAAKTEAGTEMVANSKLLITMSRVFSMAAEDRQTEVPISGDSGG